MNAVRITIRTLGPRIDDGAQAFMSWASAAITFRKSALADRIQIVAVKRLAA